MKINLLIILVLCCVNTTWAASYDFVVAKDGGALSQSRVKWSRQLTDEEANKLSVSAIFGDWDAESVTKKHMILR